MTQTRSIIHSVLRAGESTPQSTILEGSGFSLTLTQSGRYLTLQCAEVPESFRSLNFVNKFFTPEQEPGNPFPPLTLGSRSNPSISSMDLVFLRGAYDDLNDKPYVFDMQGVYQERLRTGFPNISYQSLAKEMCLRIQHAITQYDPQKVVSGNRMEGGEAQTPVPPRFRNRIAPALKNTALLSTTSSIEFDMDCILGAARKGPHLLTFGTVLHQAFIEQAISEGAALVPWGNGLVDTPSKLNLVVLDHFEAGDLSYDGALDFLAQASEQGILILFVSQEYGLGSIPMKEEHRNHMRVMALRQQIAAQVAYRSLFFPVASHYIEGVESGALYKS